MYYFFHVVFNFFQICFTQKIRIKWSNETALCCNRVNKTFFFQFIVSPLGCYDTDS